MSKYEDSRNIISLRIIFQPNLIVDGVRGAICFGNVTNSGIVMASSVGWSVHMVSKGSRVRFHGQLQFLPALYKFGAVRVTSWIPCGLTNQRFTWFLSIPVLKTSFWGGSYRTMVSARLAQLVSSVCMVSGRSIRRRSRKIFQGGGGVQTFDPQFRQAKKIITEAKTEGSFIGVTSYFMRLFVCTSLFPLFFST